MRVVVGSTIRIYDPSPDVLRQISEQLTIPNPEYEKKLRLGLWLGNTPEKLKLYRLMLGYAETPYGAISWLFRYLLKEGKAEWDMVQHGSVSFGGTVPLYDYQRRAVDDMKDRLCGILQAPAGSGKTQMGLALAAEIGKPTLWITHTHDLLKQSMERAGMYFDRSGFGTITEGKVEIGGTITFATVQTLSNCDLVSLKDTWETVIVDECHRVAGSPTSATMFYRVLNNLSAPRKYGLSATVHRADGLIKTTTALLGPVMYEVPAEEVADKVVKVSVRPRATDFTIPDDCTGTDGTLVYARLITAMAQDKARTRQIYTDLMENRGHSCLILAARTELLRALCDMLPGDCGKALITGKMQSRGEKEKREQAVEDMREGKIHFLFATYQLAKEGLDIPRLDRLFLATPESDYAVVTQAVGRVARAFDGKGKPVVYDYVDEGRFFQKRYRARRTSYRKLGCEMEE